MALGDATARGLLDHVTPPAEDGCHTICELHKLRLKWFGIHICLQPPHCHLVLNYDKQQTISPNI